MGSDNKKESVKKELDDQKKEKKQIDFSKQGKKNRAAGVRFEAKVRENLESLGWIVAKWTNTVDYDREGHIGKVVPAKRKYNPFMKAMVIGTGFPDLIAFKNSEKYHKKEGEIQLMKGLCDKCGSVAFGYDVGNELIHCDCGNIVNAELVKEGEELKGRKTEIIGIEVKRNGYLDRIEKDMCIWLLENKIFSRILIAKSMQNGRKLEVEYDDFEEKYIKSKKNNKEKMKIKKR